jgi:glycosyltransferase involved in cell wall biosynthesis
MIKVSAICSVYNGAQFIRGRIDDLMNQTLYKSGELEIIVVNSASTDTTGAILEREYLPHITLIQTPFRESMYAAWNRAIQLAKGEYIVPANVDDRLRPDAYEVMVNKLDEQPAAGMVCPNSYVTAQANAKWDNFEASHEAPYIEGRLDFFYSPHSITEQCTIGNTPMWRKEVHERVGYFDQSYLIAGDYEFALRLVANGVLLMRFNEICGLFYFHPSTQGQVYSAQSAYESRRAILKWKPVIEGNHARETSQHPAYSPAPVHPLG